MKKNTYSVVYNFLTANGFDNAEILAEFEKELNRNAAKATATASLYDAAKAVVMENLGTTPVTIGELYDAIEHELPDGFTKGKLQYAMTRLWADDLVKVEGKVNTYARKA
jgi:hypothetical protein